MHERDSWEEAVFVTLTYDPEHLPKDESLDKWELVRFFKRLRKSLFDRRLRHFSVGEYGDRNGRPHYHCIIFGLGLDDKSIIDQAWRLGSIHCGTVTYDSCRYVSDYIFTVYNGSDVSRYGGRYPPFRIGSVGFGAKYCELNEDQLRVNLSLTVRGAPMGLPRYYRKRLGIDKSCYMPLVIERSAEDAELLNKSGVPQYERRKQKRRILDALADRVDKGVL